MCQKRISLLLFVIVLVGVAIVNGVEIGIILFFVLSTLAILAWFKNVKASNFEKTRPKKLEEEELFVGEDGQEFHNDFSKVPAGGADPVSPLPRSIGYGYGDGGRSTYEDLERIGIDTSKVDKVEK